MIAHDHTTSNKITEDLHVLEQLSPSSFFSTNADHVMVLYNCDVAVSCVAVAGEMLLLSSCVSSGWWQHNDEKTRSGGWAMAPTPTNVMIFRFV